MSTVQVNVLFIWDVHPELKEYLEKGLEDVENLKLLFPSPANEEINQEYVLTADIIVGWRPPEGLLEKAERLKLFINPGAGVQHHIRRFRELNKSKEVVLVNGHSNSYFTAQHAVALLLTLMNKIVPHHKWMMEGKWRRGDDFERSSPLRWRKIGLLGYGAVNSKVHQFLSGFDNEFHVLRTNWKDGETYPTDLKKYTPKELENFLRTIDVLILAVPQTQDTEDLIGQRELELLGPSGYLVNMARGSVVNEEALYNALKKRVIAGAAIDVWYNYQPEPDIIGRQFPFSKRFYELDNIIMSPHRGASPMNDLHRWNEVIENITRFCVGRTDFLNQVNLERGY